MKEADVVIIGGGPAGINCALECIENKLDVLVLEREKKLGGQIRTIPSRIRNLATQEYTCGEELADGMEQFAAEILQGRVLRGVSVESVDLSTLTLETDTGLFCGRTLVLATGYRVRRLALDGDDRLGEHVLYRSGPHLEALSGKPVLVVGGGDSAVLSALDLVKKSSSVHLSIRSSEYKARPDLVELVEKNAKINVIKNSLPLALEGDDRLRSVSLQVGGRVTNVDCEKMVVKIGYQPNTELFRGQVELDSRDHVVVDSDCQSSRENVFVAGDIVHNGQDRIAYALGSGIIAARAARRALGHNI